MSSQPDPLGAHSSSFSARRSAASHLPAFQLPGPPTMHRAFPPFTAINASQPPPANAGNLLTPPNVSGDGLSPISSGLNSVSSGSNPGMPYTPISFWQQQGQSQSPYGFSSGATPQPLYASQSSGPNPPFSGRSLYSPLSGTLGRSSNSPATGDNLPPPPHYDQLPPFSSSVSMSAPNGPTSATLPTLSMQQQLPSNSYINSQPPTTSATQPSPTHTYESYSSPHRPPPTPYYSGSQPSSTPHQPSFPAPYSTASPSQLTPLTSTAPASRVSPISLSPAHPPLLQPAPPPPLHHFGRPPPSFGNYPLPAVSGPIMSNVHSPGASMTLVGGVPSGLMPNSMLHSGMPHMYPAHHPHAQQQPQNDRPFKCDLCPQSFNRNHDLKRHKRIHLAVKPFPCQHCEKSFSRKDALKRHILVKGCGRPQASDSSEVKQEDSSSSSKVEAPKAARSNNDGPAGSPRSNPTANKTE
ncbi:MAG: hypothetical protein M1813_003947 [Trichoglossum hirsutum]|nr:MAG: hypothetical protein M1813_003947 [Trichoglossum hirsutum]